MLVRRMQAGGVDWSIVKFVGTERAHEAVREAHHQVTFASLRLTSPHFASLRFTSLRFTSPHFASLRFASLHLTSPHLTSPHCASLHTPLHLTSLDFTPRQQEATRAYAAEAADDPDAAPPPLIT